MILIGTMNITTTRDRGNFYCPTCGVDQTYRKRAKRPFLTLYFIPTVPVAAAELFIQCDACNSTWDESVLEMNRESHEAAKAGQFAEEAIRASVLVTLVDGTISESEISALRRIATHLLDREVDRDEIGRLCSIAQQNQIEASNYVLTISQHWNQTQRASALQSMFLAATADPAMSDAKLNVLANMREILEMTDQEYQSAIESALALDAYV
jgi:uncharacterized tellurite resistance protein B-like protein